MKRPELETTPLSDHLYTLLRDVLAKRAPQFATALRDGTDLVTLGDQKSTIQSIVGDELIETGFLPNYEPTQRGLELEDLIDALCSDE